LANKKKIGVVYDTSYLIGDFQSLKAFILSRRFSRLEKPKLLKSLASVLAGKGRPEQTVYHNPDELFVVTEIVPTEVIEEIQSESPGKDDVVGRLLEGGALKVDLNMDTVVSNMGLEVETERKLALFAQRLVSYMTLEKYDLSIVASENDALISDLAEKAKLGRAVLGLKSEHLTRTRLLHDKITEMANWDRSDKIIMEN
jgi:hypothetical protein